MMELTTYKDGVKICQNDLCVEAKGKHAEDLSNAVAFGIGALAIGTALAIIFR